MKDAYHVLREKEADLARVRKQVECLNIAAPLLADEDEEEQCDSEDAVDEDETSDKKPSSSVVRNNAQQTDWMDESSPFLNALKRAR